MFVDFTKRVLTISTAAVLICSQAYALPPGRTTKVFLEYDHGVAVGRISDQVTPWNVQRNVAKIFPSTISDIANANTNFEYIVYPTSKYYGDLSDAYLRVSEYNHAKSFPVEITNPDHLNPHNHNDRRSYAERYSMIEVSVKNAINNILMIRGPKVKIAVGSFYNPVYFSDEKAVAFYTLAGIHEALQDSDRTGQTKVTILCDGNAKLAESMNYYYEMYKMAQEAVDKGLHDEMLRVFDVEFKVATQVDRQAETDFFLDHMDRFADLGRYNHDGAEMSRYDVMQMILGNSVGNLAPQHVLDMIRKTMQNLFATSKEPMVAVQAHIQKIALKKFGTEEKAREATDKIMKSLTAEFTLSRVGAYFTILDEKTTDLDVIKKAVERVVKK